MLLLFVSSIVSLFLSNSYAILEGHVPIFIICSFSVIDFKRTINSAFPYIIYFNPTFRPMQGSAESGVLLANRANDLGTAIRYIPLLGFCTSLAGWCCVVLPSASFITISKRNQQKNPFAPEVWQWIRLPASCVPQNPQTTQLSAQTSFFPMLRRQFPWHAQFMAFYVLDVTLIIHNSTLTAIRKLLTSHPEYCLAVS